MKYSVKGLLLALLISPVFFSCDKKDDEDDKNNNSQYDELTSHRWKHPDVWEDYCDTVTQPISGYEYLTFRNDFTVLYELELTGNTYGCTGDEEVVGNWKYENGKYYAISDDDTFEIEIAADGSRICWSEGIDTECWLKE